MSLNALAQVNKLELNHPAYLIRQIIVQNNLHLELTPTGLFLTKQELFLNQLPNTTLFITGINQMHFYHLHNFYLITGIILKFLFKYNRQILPSILLIQNLTSL